MLKEPELAALKQIASEYAALGVSLPKLRQRQQETQAIAAHASGEAKTPTAELYLHRYEHAGAHGSVWCLHDERDRAGRRR